MIKALLLMRLTVEVIFGALCMAVLLLLPSIWEGVFPQTLVFGYLGMPLHYSDPAVMQRFNTLSRLAGLLGVSLAVLSGVLWFRDVQKVIQKLRTIHTSFLA